VAVVRLNFPQGGIDRPAAVGLGLLIVGAAGVAAMNATLSPYMITLACLIGLNVMLAASLTLTNGFTGLFSLGHPAFMTVGGYIAAVLLPALLAGGIGAAATALIVGYPVLRLRGHYLAVATLGLIIIVRVLANNMEGYTRGPLGISGMPKLTTLWWVFGWTALTVFVCWRIKHSSLGRAMMSVREDELAAQSVGISPAFVRMAAFVLGAFFAGVAGGLWAHLITVMTPNSFSILLAFNLVVMVVIGGSGSITGAILAAVAISALTETLRSFQTQLGVYGLSQIAIALCVILVLIFRPQGVFGSREPAFVTGRPG
jgi:branched-chain amino acid transport system permease protein